MLSGSGPLGVAGGDSFGMEEVDEVPVGCEDVEWEVTVWNRTCDAATSRDGRDGRSDNIWVGHQLQPFALVLVPQQVALPLLQAIGVASGEAGEVDGGLAGLRDVGHEDDDELVADVHDAAEADHRDAEGAAEATGVVLAESENEAEVVDGDPAQAGCPLDDGRTIRVVTTAALEEGLVSILYCHGLGGPWRTGGVK